MSERPELCAACESRRWEECGREFLINCVGMRLFWDAGYARALADVRAALSCTMYEGMPEAAELKELRRAVRRVLALGERR